MKIHYLQHAACEPPHEIAAWAETRGHALTGTRVFADEPLPALESFDALVVMGGPMNIYEEDLYPWLAHEKDLLRAAIDAGKGALGVCLGAQLLADVLGGPVTRNAQPEIGWWTVELTPEGAASPLFEGIPQSFSFMHWHGDTFAIPPGAVHAARSEACAHQAFASADGRVLALQFHLEENACGVDLLLEHWAADLIDAPFVQSAAAMRAQTASRIAETRPILFRLLDNWARHTAD